jgi:hypothetical protein
MATPRGENLPLAYPRIASTLKQTRHKLKISGCRLPFSPTISWERRFDLGDTDRKLNTENLRPVHRTSYSLAKKSSIVGELHGFGCCLNLDELHPSPTSWSPEG